MLHFPPHCSLLQTEPYTPEPPLSYPPPPPPITELRRTFSDGGPLLERVWDLLNLLPLLPGPDLLLQELVAPSLHNFSLTSTPIEVLPLTISSPDSSTQVPDLGVVTVQQIVLQLVSWLRLHATSLQEQDLGPEDYPGPGLLWMGLEDGVEEGLSSLLEGLKGQVALLREGLEGLRAMLTEDSVTQWLEGQEAASWRETVQGVLHIYLHFYRLYAKDYTARTHYGGSMEYHQYYDYMEQMYGGQAEWYAYPEYAGDYYGSNNYYDSYSYYDYYDDYSTVADGSGSGGGDSDYYASQYDYYYYDDQWVNFPEVSAFFYRLSLALDTLAHSQYGQNVVFKLARSVPWLLFLLYSANVTPGLPWLWWTSYHWREWSRWRRPCSKMPRAV